LSQATGVKPLRRRSARRKRKGKVNVGCDKTRRKKTIQEKFFSRQISCGGEGGGKKKKSAMGQEKGFHENGVGFVSSKHQKKVS